MKSLNTIYRKIKLQTIILTSNFKTSISNIASSLSNTPRNRRDRSQILQYRNYDHHLSCFLFQFLRHVSFHSTINNLSQSNCYGRQKFKFLMFLRWKLQLGGLTFYRFAIICGVDFIVFFILAMSFFFGLIMNATRRYVLFTFMIPSDSLSPTKSPLL